jgi:hypothetical protein
MNILIYDVAGSHFNKVRDTFLHFCDVEVNVLRVDFGAEFKSVIVQNDVKVMIIPYQPFSIEAFTDVIQLGCIPILPHIKPFGTPFQEVMRSTIRVWGGVNESTILNNSNPPSETITPGLEYFTECENLVCDERLFGSFIVAKVGALLTNVIAQDYTIWEARQILRQNASQYPNYTLKNGFGKLPESVTIPQAIDEFPPVDVFVARNLESNSTNVGAGALYFNSPNGQIVTTGDVFNRSESPSTIQGDDKSYSIDYRRTYGGIFTQYEFELGEYAFTEAPKKPEFFYWAIGNGRDVYIGRERVGNNWIKYPQEQQFDRYRVRIFDINDQLIYEDSQELFDSLFRWVTDRRTFTSWDPFFLNNSGNTYKFQFKTFNAFGESDWSDSVVIVDDGSYQGQVFDFRTASEPSEPTPPQPPPPQPEPEPLPAVRPIVTQKQRTANEITLTIEDNFPQAIVQRRSPSGTFETIATTADAEFTDTVPDSAQTYIYRLANTNGEVQSEFSDLIYVAGIRTEITLFPCTIP